MLRAFAGNVTKLTSSTQASTTFPTNGTSLGSKSSTTCHQAKVDELYGNLLTSSEIYLKNTKKSNSLDKGRDIATTKRKVRATGAVTANTNGILNPKTNSTNNTTRNVSTTSTQNSRKSASLSRLDTRVPGHIQSMFDNSLRRFATKIQKDLEHDLKQELEQEQKQSNETTSDTTSDTTSEITSEITSTSEGTPNPSIPTPSTPLQRLASFFGVYSPKQIVLSEEKVYDPNYNRWKNVPPAMIMHLALGSVFACSMFNTPLQTLHGVVAAAPSDWDFSHIAPVFSITMACFGLFSAALGRIGFFERLGPRGTSLVGTSLLCSAYAIAAVAVSIHSLPLLYTYSALCGIAIGAAYVPPISTLMKWFPDRKGLASAMGVMGFGAGGIVAASVIAKSLDKFAKAPIFLGKPENIAIEIKDGKSYVNFETLPKDVIERLPTEILEKTTNAFGPLHEVVSTSAESIRALPLSLAETIEQGVYLVGTGSTGAFESFAILGLLYTTATLAATTAFRLPPENYDPTKQRKKDIGNVQIKDTLTKPMTVVANATEVPTAPVTSTTPVTPTPVTPKYPHVALGDVAPKNAFKTRQFWTVWLGICANATSAYAIIGNAKNMMLGMYGSMFPTIVTSAFASVFIMSISLANLSGRIFWGAVSDKIGTKNAFSWMYGLSAPLYMLPILSLSYMSMTKDFSSVNTLEHLSLLSESALTATTDPNAVAPTLVELMPLITFYSSIMVAITCFGGAAAVTAAYVSDLFGAKNVAANQGQILSYLLLGGFLGPMIGSYLLKQSTFDAIMKLAEKIDPAVFETTFGMPIDNLQELVDLKIVTISKLMEIVPPGVADPSPFIFNNVFYLVASLQVFAFLLNMTMRRVNPKFYETIVAQTTMNKMRQFKNVATLSTTKTTQGKIVKPETVKVVAKKEVAKVETVKKDTTKKE